MKDFSHKTAVITGGASGIGFAMAERFAKAGMHVVLADIEEAALEAARKELESHQYAVHGVVTNTMRKESIENLLEETSRQFGNVHILCNNAGVAAGPKPIWEIADEDWQWVMGVNFWGVLYGIQAFVPHMLAHGEPSHIVNTASLAGVLPGGGPYGVSKHGVLVLSESLYRDLAKQNASIGISVLCPGTVSTNIAYTERNRPEELHTRATAGFTGEMADAMNAVLAMGKKPVEIAEAVFDAIENENLYVLPHPAWDDYVLDRVKHILARGGPLSIDAAEMNRRREKGEVF